MHGDATTRAAFGYGVAHVDYVAGGGRHQHDSPTSHPRLKRCPRRRRHEADINKLRSAPLRRLLGASFRFFGHGLFRSACLLFNRTLFYRALFYRPFHSRYWLGRFFRSRMFDMNPLNISRRSVFLRPFEGRLKWDRLHKQ